MLLVIDEDRNKIWFKSVEDNYNDLHCFVQYLIDDYTDLESYVIVGDKFKMDMLIYVKLTEMHKRSFEEKMKHVLTGSVPQKVTQQAIIKFMEI